MNVHTYSYTSSPTHAQMYTHNHTPAQTHRNTQVHTHKTYTNTHTHSDKPIYTLTSVNAGFILIKIYLLLTSIGLCIF